MTDLATKTCKPCEGGVDPINRSDAEKLLADIPEWSLSEDGKCLIRHYKFRNFLRTMSFVNALAWVANQENHHPDVQLGYDYCRVMFTTHAMDGLSENDFICAAKVNAL